MNIVEDLGHISTDVFTKLLLGIGGNRQFPEIKLVEIGNLRK